jgi:hypothetical protein
MKAVLRALRSSSLCWFVVWIVVLSCLNKCLSSMHRGSSAPVPLPPCYARTIYKQQGLGLGWRSISSCHGKRLHDWAFPPCEPNCTIATPAPSLYGSPVLRAHLALSGRLDVGRGYVAKGLHGEGSGAYVQRGHRRLQSHSRYNSRKQHRLEHISPLFVFSVCVVYAWREDSDA